MGATAEQMEKHARVVELAEKGIPVRAIAARTGVTERSCYRILKKRGITPAKDPYGGHASMKEYP